MFYKSKTCNYQTQLSTIVLIIIAVVENGAGTIAIFLSNILLLMNYEGRAEKFSYRFFFSIFILVASVTANIEMTPPMIGLHMAGKISRRRWRLKVV